MRTSWAPCRWMRSSHLHRLPSTPARGLISVRPDGYIGFRCQTADANQLAAWLSLVSAADHGIHTQNAATQPPHPDRFACPPGTCLPVTATGIDIGSAKRAAVSSRALTMVWHLARITSSNGKESFSSR